MYRHAGGILQCGTCRRFAQDKFRSRALLDATVTDYGKEDVQGYYRLEDFRVGFKANYGQFELKADIGFGGGKVAIKDLLFNYHMKTAWWLWATPMNLSRWICS